MLPQDSTFLGSDAFAQRFMCVIDEEVALAHG